MITTKVRSLAHTGLWPSAPVRLLQVEAVALQTCLSLLEHDALARLTTGSSEHTEVMSVMHRRPLTTGCNLFW